MKNQNDQLLDAIKKIADPNGVVAKFGALIGNIELAELTMIALSDKGATAEARNDARYLHFSRILQAHREFRAAGGTIKLMQSMP